MGQFLIRPERSSDEAPIRRVTAAAFRASPHGDHGEADLVEALRQAGALSLSLVASEGGAIIGHAAFSPVTIGEGGPGWYGLGPIAVDPAHQGRGIGSGLVRGGLALLRQSGAQGCVVLGDPAWYGRFGFRSRPGLHYPGVPEEYFMALPFDPGRQIPSGPARYHDAFSQAGGEEV